MSRHRGETLAPVYSSNDAVQWPLLDSVISYNCYAAVCVRVGYIDTATQFTISRLYNKRDRIDNVVNTSAPVYIYIYIQFYTKRDKT